MRIQVERRWPLKHLPFLAGSTAVFATLHVLLHRPQPLAPHGSTRERVRFRRPPGKILKAVDDEGILPAFFSQYGKEALPEREGKTR